MSPRLDRHDRDLTEPTAPWPAPDGRWRWSATIGCIYAGISAGLPGRAGGDNGIAGGEAFSVDAGLVELELVHAFAGGVLTHVVRAAVASGAEFRNGGARGLTLEALFLIHGDVGIVAGPVAAVTIGATQPVGDVYVVIDEGGGAIGGVIDRGVAGHAGIRGGGAAWDYPHGEPQKEENNRRSHLKYPSNVKTTR